MQANAFKRYNFLFHFIKAILLKHFIHVYNKSTSLTMIIGNHSRSLSKIVRRLDFLIKLFFSKEKSLLAFVFYSIIYEVRLEQLFRKGFFAKYAGLFKGYLLYIMNRGLNRLFSAMLLYELGCHSDTHSVISWFCVLYMINSQSILFCHLFY